MSVSNVDLGVFTRQWAVEGRRIAWLLGAGASASANVPTAWQITLDLLARLYASAHGLVLQDLDVGDQATREAILRYYDGMNGMPPAGDPSDYSTAFQLAFPDEGPRRQYLRALFRDRAPSYGQRILGALLAQGNADLVMTTNFDDLIEQASDQARSALSNPSRPRLGIAALDSPSRASLALSDDDFPHLIKLHGDFREAALKNLERELQRQDVVLRQAFLDSSRRFGLAVVGYSGRDSSVVQMLTDAVKTPNALPGGLWWLTRETDSVLPAVADLMSAADSAGVTARYVKIENFDETLAALGRQATLEPVLRMHVDRLRAPSRVTDAAIPELDAGPLPVLRTNALPIRSFPTRALEGTLRTSLSPDEIRQALRSVNWRGAHAASGQRILALGSSSLLSSALALTGSPTEIPIDCTGKDATAQERALAYEALTRALARRLPTRAVVRRRGHQLVVRPVRADRPDTPGLAAARTQLGLAYGDSLTGHCPTSLGKDIRGNRRAFAEGVRLSIEWRLGVLWLLFVPHTWVAAADSSSARPVRAGGDPASAWRKERWVSRRNERWASIIDTWAKLLAPDEETKIPVLPDLSVRDLVGGEFVLARTTAYSRVAR